MSSDIDENVMEDILNGIVGKLDKETPSTIKYKGLSATAEDSLYNILNIYEMATLEQYFIVSKIIKHKFGITRINDELYWFIRDFPNNISRLSKEIEKNEGPVCCVDKAWQRSMDEFKRLIELNHGSYTQRD